MFVPLIFILFFCLSHLNELLLNWNKTLKKECCTCTTWNSYNDSAVCLKWREKSSQSYTFFGCSHFVFNAPTSNIVDVVVIAHTISVLRSSAFHMNFLQKVCSVKRMGWTHEAQERILSAYNEEEKKTHLNITFATPRSCGKMSFNNFLNPIQFFFRGVKVDNMKRLLFQNVWAGRRKKKNKNLNYVLDKIKIFYVY